MLKYWILFEALIASGLLVATIHLVIGRIKEKKRETFEKREN